MEYLRRIDFVALCIEMLNDDYGINGTVWSLMEKHLTDMGEYGILAMVECTDGRYYIPEEDD